MSIHNYHGEPTAFLPKIIISRQTCDKFGRKSSHLLRGQKLWYCSLTGWSGLVPDTKSYIRSGY